VKSGAANRNAAQFEVVPCAFQKLTSGLGNTPVALFENDDLRTPVITAPTETLVIAGRKAGSAVLIQIKSGPLQNRVLFWTAEQNLALRSPACGR
jgi:hypothetical protein